MRVIAYASHSSGMTTVKVYQDTYYQKVEYVLEYEKGKWSANGLRIQSSDGTIRDVRQLLTDAENLKKEIGTSRDPAEIIRRFASYMEADSIRLYPGYSSENDPYKLEMKISDYLDNPREFVDALVRYHEFKNSKGE